MRIVVTGGAGFIGGSLCIALRERHPDWGVVAVDNLYRRGSELNLARLSASGVEFVHADVRRPEELDGLEAFDALVECSAETSVLSSAAAVVPVNLVGAHNCFELARGRDAQVVFLSTSRVYPVAALDALDFEELDTRFELTDTQATPGASAAGIAENFSLEGRRTVYGASKLAAELLLGEYEVPWVINRCGVVAGPWQMGKVDQGVFTHWAMSAHFSRALSYIGYGGSGKQVRDVLHVADLVDLIERQLSDPRHWSGHTFNVGGGRENSLSLLEASALCEEFTGRTLDVGSIIESRPGDVRYYASDCRALFAHSDWRPRRAPSEVIEDTLRWIASNESLIRTAL